MITIKKYSFRFLYTILSLLLCFLILTALYHFNIISNPTYRIFKLAILLINILISGMILGKKAMNKGYLEGIKLGAFIILLFLFSTLLTGQELKLKLLLYDGIIMTTAILGGMIGINKKKPQKSNGA